MPTLYILIQYAQMIVMLFAWLLRISVIVVVLTVISYGVDFHRNMCLPYIFCRRHAAVLWLSLVTSSLCRRRERGVVTPVRNQADCGACWAFSTVEVLESMNALRTGNLTQLSVQQVSRTFCDTFAVLFYAD